MGHGVCRPYVYVCVCCQRASVIWSGRWVVIVARRPASVRVSRASSGAPATAVPPDTSRADRHQCRVLVSVSVCLSLCLSVCHRSSVCLNAMNTPTLPAGGGNPTHASSRVQQPTTALMWPIIITVFSLHYSMYLSVRFCLCVSVCWSQPSALQKRINRSRCCLEYGLGWAKIYVLNDGPDSLLPQGRW